MHQYKCAIVGLGDIAKYQIKALEHIDHLKLIAVCDTDKEKLRNFNLTTFDDIDLLLQTKPDAIIVSVPSALHYEIASKILEFGCNVLVEKPPTETLEQFDQLCKISEKNSKVFYSSYHFVFSRDFQWFIKNYYPKHKDELGEITGFKACFYDPYIKDNKLESGRQNLGGSWIDSGINALSIILQVIPPDISIKKAHFCKNEIFNCNEISSTVTFNFGNSYTGEVFTDWTSKSKQKQTQLTFSKGVKFILDHDNQKVIRHLNNKIDTTLIDFHNGLSRQMARYIGVFQDFINDLNKKTDNRSFSRRCLELLLKAYER